MERMISIRIGTFRVQLLKLIGAFIIIGGAVMVLANVYKLFWLTSIIKMVNAGGYQSVTVDLAGIVISQPLRAGDVSTQLGMLLVPIAGIMFWAAVMVFGSVVYRISPAFLYTVLPKVEVKVGKVKKKK